MVNLLAVHQIFVLFPLSSNSVFGKQLLPIQKPQTSLHQGGAM